MKSTVKAAVAVLTAFAISSGLFGIAAPALAQMQTGGNTTATTPEMSMGMGEEEGGDMMMNMMHEMMANHRWGMISSINNDGEADWIISGNWMMEMASQNDTATTSNATTGMLSNIAAFNAILHMVMLDGSAMHDHELSNFTQTEDATFDSTTNTTTITGTATITMRGSPVPNVPTTIQIAQDQVIAISPDAAALENHFGTEPIFGIVVTPEMIEQMMMRYGDKMGMSHTMEGPMDDTVTMNSSGGM